MISINQSGDISRLPLGQAVFGYTFVYLLYSILNPGKPYNYVKQNIPTLVFFPLLITFDGLWNIKNSCYTFFQLLFSLVLAGLSGWLWAYIIDSTNTDSLKYFVGGNANQVCSAPSSSTFKCAVYKNGELLSTNMSTPSSSSSS
jgi:hypothetical protein